MRVPAAERADFVKRWVLAWYQDYVVDTYDSVPTGDPSAVRPGDFDGWSDGFRDDLTAAFGRAALEGASDLLEGTIGDFIELVARQWDGTFPGAVANP